MKRIKAIHDNPFGKLHPYWARKPLNVVREIIQKLSNEGDLVLDPFMGGGSIVFAALMEKRRVIASDINPLAYLIVNSSLQLIRKKGCIEILEKFRKEYEAIILPWFKYDSNFFIERQRFETEGKYEYGKFKLVPTDTILKQYKGGSFFGRRILKNGENGYRPSIPTKYKAHPINFKDCHLQANTRIAIPKGSRLDHFFTAQNQASINAALGIARSYDSEMQGILLFLISTCLPLLRLSDYKASSQWPYWRPKKNLTSRNPLVAISKRLRDFKKAYEWSEKSFPEFKLSSIKDCVSEKNKISASIFTSAIQNLSYFKELESIDLIVTDPPYSDQVPYLEYSSLWIQTLGLVLNKKSYDLEMVKTDASNRKHQNEKYIDVLSSSIEICAGILRLEGYMVWFYQDYNLVHWGQIYETAFKNNLSIEDVIPLSKQRRSMKAVTSPGRTFDGDLIIIFKKKDNLKKTGWTISQAENRCREIIRQNSSLFTRYSYLIKDGMVNGWLTAISKKYKTVNNLIESLA